MRRTGQNRYIGTFHKTGTVLFESILRTAHERAMLVPWLMHEPKKPAYWDVAFDYHSTKLLDDFDANPESSRYVISLRDPRDVIISAAYYHCKSHEGWLHVRNRKFGGLTYQEKINSFETMMDRFLFEMDHSSFWEIKQMLRVPFDAKSLLVTKLETLVTDFQLTEFRRLFTFLNFDVETIHKLLPVARENSMFSGSVAASLHARSGRPAQYLSEFNDLVLRRYYETYGDAAERLGYPP